MRGHNKDEDYIWIEVTQDEYRHIIKMADSARELADQCGVTKETVITTAWRVEKGTNKKGRFERVLLRQMRSTFTGRPQSPARHIPDCDDGVEPGEEIPALQTMHGAALHLPGREC